jgi:hypothetical protein
MPRYIDADMLCRHFKILYEHAQTNGLYNHAKLYDRVVRFVVDAPTEDVVEVVRCKDCTYYREENGFCMNPHCGKSYYGTPVRENQYCSFGEREG